MRNAMEPGELSLQDVVSGLMMGSSPVHNDLLIAADMVKEYFKRPLHEITVEAMREKHRNFPLYLSFLRLPQEEVDSLTALVSQLIAWAEVINNERTELAVHGLSCSLSERKSIRA